MRIFILIFCLLPTFASADDRLVRLFAPAPLVESGLLKHILPRFSLKTQVRVEMVPEHDSADAVLGSQGQALFSGLGETWHIAVADAEHAGTARFVDWLNSDIGKRTIFGFAPNGTEVFAPPKVQAVAAVEVELDGDAVLGKSISRIQCGRCHVTERARSMSGIGSTPSFFVLRSFEDWEERFSAFYVLKPHGAFTQIEDVTEPFPIDRPSPIAPIELTLDELEAVLAYVAAMKAADLGAPLQHQ